MIWIYYSLFALCVIQTLLSLSIPSDNLTNKSIPKINLDELQKLLENSKNGSFDGIESLLDNGGKLGVIEISNLGLDYENAVNNLKEYAPSCIGSAKHNIPQKIQLPDGSFRTTYATTNKTYLECLDMSVLSQTFDQIDTAMIHVINKFNNEQHSTTLCSKNNKLGFIVDNETIPIGNALQKEHIHVYSTKEKHDRDNPQSTKLSDYLVPFHVDNGLYLIITPFQEHAMKVKLSNGKIVSTNHIESDSALVLIGRGLTDWLLSPTVANEMNFYAVPHSVPTLDGTKFKTRSVYARMKIPKPSSISAMRTCLDYDGFEGTFHDFFNSG